MQEYIIRNNTNEEVELHDLGIILEPNEERNLTLDFDVLTIVSSLSLKREVMYEHVSVNGVSGMDGFGMLTSTNIPMYNGFYVTWPSLKRFIGNKENVIVYFDLGCRYHIFSPHYNYYTYIYKGGPVHEVSKIDLSYVTNPGILEGAYIDINDVDGTGYRIWFNIDSLTATPQSDGRQLICINITSSSDIEEIIDAISNMLNESYGDVFRAYTVPEYPNTLFVMLLSSGVVDEHISTNCIEIGVSVYDEGSDYRMTSDEADFVTNYKEWCDNVKTVRADGRMRVHSTVLMENEHTMFLGCDDGDDRDGYETILAATIPGVPGYEHVFNLTYADDIRIEDGCLTYYDAPWYALLNIEVVSPGPCPPLPPVGTVVSHFVKNVPLYGTNPVGKSFDTDAPGTMVKPFVLRIRVTNPDGAMAVGSIDFNDATTASLAGRYFIINNDNGSTAVWFNLDESSNAPSFNGNTIGVLIYTGYTAEQIADALVNALNEANIGVSAECNGTVVTVTNDTKRELPGFIIDNNTSLNISAVDNGKDVPELQPWRILGEIKVHRRYTTVAQELYGL